MKKLKWSLIVFFGVIELVIFLYVKKTLKEDTIELTQKEQEKKFSPEFKPVVVNITVQNLNSSQAYRLRTENSSSLLDALQELQRDKKITFELDEYTYGTKIYSFNGIKSSDLFEWKVYLRTRSEDVNNQIENLGISKEQQELLDKTLDTFANVTEHIGDISLPDNAEIKIVFEKVD